MISYIIPESQYIQLADYLPWPDSCPIRCWNVIDWDCLVAKQRSRERSFKQQPLPTYSPQSHKHMQHTQNTNLTLWTKPTIQNVFIPTYYDGWEYNQPQQNKNVHQKQIRKGIGKNTKTNPPNLPTGAPKVTFGETFGSKKNIGPQKPWFAET